MNLTKLETLSVKTWQLRIASTVSLNGDYQMKSLERSIILTERCGGFVGFNSAIKENCSKKNNAFQLWLLLDENGIFLTRL